MSITKILKHEQNNVNSIFLRKEGLFYRAYELSAYFFVTHIQSYSITKKYVKTAKQEIVYIGFPASYLQNILQKVTGNEVVNRENEIEICGFTSNVDYTEWKNSISVTIKEEKPVGSISTVQNPFQHQRLIEKIRQFSVATNSPIDAQQFLIEIQHELNVIVS
jgi:hypothetical protein